MCIICDAKKLSADPKKTAAEINRELLGIVERMAAGIDVIANTCALIHHEGRALTPTEAAKVDAIAEGFLARNEPSPMPSPEEVAQMLSNLLGVEVEVTRVTIKPDDETSSGNHTKH